MKTITLHVGGTKCASCKILIENTLGKQSGIANVRVDLSQKTVSFETSLEEDEKQLAEKLSVLINQHGYVLSTEDSIDGENNNAIMWQALPIGLAFLAAFFLLQKSGILNFGIGGTPTVTTSFVIGLIASVSSCLAVVGGLVLSLSATVSQDKVNDTRPMLLFHGGRLLGFALLGGLLGVLGKAVGISFTLGAILGVLAAVVMILLGLNLVGVFAKNIAALPPSIFAFFRKVEHGTFAPFLLGVGTFFLPCGFTQAMQIVALSSGSFFSGSLIMLAFALGTLPMLTLLSFGSASFAQSKHAPLFFKSAGIVVIGFGIFALLSGLAGLGVINPLFSI